MSWPLFQPGDLLLNGAIVRTIPDAQWPTDEEVAAMNAASAEAWANRDRSVCECCGQAVSDD